MTADVNPTGEGGTLRQAQTALTEQRIVAAATELFLADGYEISEVPQFHTDTLSVSV